MSIEQTEQAPNLPPFIPGYRKLADFIQPPKQSLPETQVISVIPRIKLPAREMTTSKMVVPWVTTWSSKAEISPSTTDKGMGQEPMHTPLPAILSNIEILSDIETLHLSTPQVGQCISIFVYTGNKLSDAKEHPAAKQQPKSLLKYIGAIIPHFIMRIFAPSLAKVPRSST